MLEYHRTPINKVFIYGNSLKDFENPLNGGRGSRDSRDVPDSTTAFMAPQEPRDNILYLRSS